MQNSAIFPPDLRVRVDPRIDPDDTTTRGESDVRAYSSCTEEPAEAATGARGSPARASRAERLAQRPRRADASLPGLRPAQGELVLPRRRRLRGSRPGGDD